MLYHYLLFHIKATSNPYFSLTTNSITEISNGNNSTQWKYVLRSCKDCPKYNIHTVECEETIHLPITSFHICEVSTICSKHDIIGPSNLLCHVCFNSVSIVKQKKTAKLSRRKILTLKELYIGEIMKEYYIPALENYLYHIFYLHVFSKTICGKMRNEGCISVTDDILSI